MLTDTSVQIITDIKNTLEPIYNINSIQFSQSTTKLLSLIFNRIAYANEKWKLNCDNIQINKINTIDFDTSYYPDEIQESLQNNIQHHYKSTFTINDRVVIIHIGTPQVYNNQKMKSIIRRIYMWLIIATFFADDKCSQSLNIFLSLTPDKKQLPKIDKDYMDREHVNTAYTYACKSNNEIHIFREEEWFKVFIHETFHSLGLDFAQFDHNNTNKQILSIFNVVADVRIFESYCEIWAELCNNMFIIFFSTRWNNTQSKWLETCTAKLKQMIQNEQMFSLFQSYKILSHFQMQYIDLLGNSVNGSPNVNYKDKTHVLSYYIIKCMFMYNIDFYIRECININGFTINFNKETTKLKANMKKYCDIVTKIYKNSTFIEDMNRTIDNVPKTMQTTLRMSAYEMK
jgi:hypothetical protein